MKFRWVSLAAIFLFSLLISSVVFALEGNAEQNAMVSGFVSRIMNYEEAGNNQMALRYALAFEEWLKKQPKEFADEIRGSNFNNIATIQARLGNYDGAIQALKDENQWKPGQISEKIIKAFEKKRDDQKIFFEARTKYLSAIAEKNKKMLSILEKKNFIIDSYKLLGAKDVTKEDLEKLQTGIQKANFWLAEFVSEKKALGEAFEKEVADIKLEGLNFPEDMLNALQEKSMLVDKLSAKALEEYNRSKEGYLEVAEKHKIGWGSLKDPIDEMINTQKEVRETQEKILEFMKKTQLAAQEKRSFIELKKKLDALLLKSGDFLRQLDKAFSDPRTFTHVPDDVAGDFKKLFEKLKELDSKIKENSAKIESFSGTLNYLFGDVNGDGKIDQADYHYLNNYITRPRYSPQAKEAWEKLDRIAGDLDGDGFISLIDLELMRERIFGGRKSFPVDPKNKRGDMNGDGEVDRFDSAMMKKALEVEGKLRGAWGRVADIDGNGTLDGHDWEAYNNLRLETEKMREEKKEQIHRTTTPPGQTENISDDQTTPTGSPFEVK